MKRFVKLAKKVAKKSTHRLHLMSAIITRGGSVLSTAYNLRGNPECFHQEQAPLGHAEKRAIRPHENYKGASITVVRLSGGCSRPCPDCYAAIKSAGIKKIAFVDEDRKFVVEKVK